MDIKTIQKILVGVDFSSYSDVARQRAFDIALVSGAEVILHHACEDADYKGQRTWLLKNKSFEELLERGKRLAARQLERLAEQGKKLGLRVTTELSDQSPDTAIIQAVEKHQVDLVVIGTHGRTGLERLMLARIAERVVRNSPCSVLVARSVGASVPSLGRILVPTDFSESANLALATACSLAANDAQIDVLHCWLTYFYSTGYEGFYQESIALEPEMGESIRQRGAELLDKYRCEGRHLSFEEKYTSPVQGICETLETKPYDMVFMGSHSRHGLKRFLLGSTAEAVVRHGNCSVFVVRERSK